MTTKKKQKPEEIVLFASLETEDDVEVEIAVHAPNRASARRVIAEITRAVTGEDPEETNAGAGSFSPRDRGFRIGRSPNRKSPRAEVEPGRGLRDDGPSRVEARAGSHQSPGPSARAGKDTLPMTRVRWPSASQSFRVKGPTVCTFSA